MITINDKSYDDVVKKVTFNRYSVTKDGKKRSGKAFFIFFKFNNIFLGLETTYDIMWLEELKTNDRKDICEYISDISYEDEKGWISLMLGNYKCFITKIKNNLFVLEFRCETEECGENYNVSLKEEIEINF